VQVNQIITLLTNLFNLTKVASVTLPGLLAAGGLAMILWPAIPLDVIPAVVQVEASSPPPRSANTPACQLQHWAVDDVLFWIEAQLALPPQSNPSTTPQDLRNIGPNHPYPPGLNPPAPGSPSAPPPGLTQEALQRMLEIEGKTQNLSVPGMRKRAIVEQFVLDYEVQSLAVCADIEKSWSGQDEIEIQILTTDIESLEKQRSAAQDNYLASLKTNNRSLSTQFREDMRQRQGEINGKRDQILEHTRNKKERERRAAELLTEEQTIKERLGDPGRLRPRIGFDLFVTGLINHIVAFILLSLAAAVIVTAIDRAWFGLLYEDLFDGF
jgi:hypothetical protein